jgi:hypothetical protein
MKLMFFKSHEMEQLRSPAYEIHPTHKFFTSFHEIFETIFFLQTDEEAQRSDNNK